MLGRAEDWAIIEHVFMFLLRHETPDITLFIRTPILDPEDKL